MTEQIYSLWQRMEQGWAVGDGHAFAAVFAEDVDFVTVRGEELFGRRATPALVSSHSCVQLCGVLARDTRSRPLPGSWA